MKNKAPLSWNLKDYLTEKEEPPACVLSGTTEGEAMEREDIIDWCEETTKILLVLREEYPEKYLIAKEDYFLDLDYLSGLGKITEEESKKLKKNEE